MLYHDVLFYSHNVTIHKIQKLLDTHNRDQPKLFTTRRVRRFL